MTFHPKYYQGINSTGFALDEMNGPGLNDTIYTVMWDSAVVISPTAFTLDAILGQTIDVWVQRERRLVYVPRERRWDRAAGRRGHASKRS